MNIIQALKDPDIIGLRVDIGNRWLYWDKAANKWIVLSSRPGHRYSVLIVTADEEEAVAMLLGQEKAK